MDFFFMFSTSYGVGKGKNDWWWFCFSSKIKIRRLWWGFSNEVFKNVVQSLFHFAYPWPLCNVRNWSEKSECKCKRETTTLAIFWLLLTRLSQDRNSTKSFLHYFKKLSEGISSSSFFGPIADVKFLLCVQNSCFPGPEK